MKQKQRWSVQEFAKLIWVVLCLLTREKKRKNKQINKKFFEKTNIESYHVFDLFRESNFYHVIAYVKKFSNSIISDFYVPFYTWKEGTTSQIEDFLIPRHGNVKKPTAIFYKIDIQTISKTRTILSENCSFHQYIMK